MLFGRHINRYYLKYLGILLIGLIALITVDYIQLKIPEIYKMVINGINNGKVEVDGVEYMFDLTFLLDQICFPMLIIIIVMVVCRFIWRICFIGTSMKIETDLRHRMFEVSKDLSQSYYQINKVGDLMSLYTNDLETIQDSFAWSLLMTFDAVFMGGLALFKMIRMNVLLGILSFIPMVILLVMACLVGKKESESWEKRQAAFSKLSDFSQESFSGITVIKAFVKELKELLAFKKLNIDNENKNVAYVKISTLLHILVSLFIESIICIILGYGGYLVYKGVFSGGELVEFLGYFSAITWPVLAVAELVDMNATGKASLKRISALLDTKSDLIDKGTEELKNAKGEIEFKELTFRYPSSEYDVLSKVCFKINAGEHVGIIGKTGCGKTTIVDLILRTYNVPDRTIYIDGKDVNTLTIKSVREQCSYVPQDNFLFSETIASNISFSQDEIKIDDVKYAANIANLVENITLFKQGYDTMLGERGVTVSGGQKQRISIARAILKDAPILILDDSVSAVDTKTEETILENLHNDRQDKTTILIAHRISTIEGMDKIIVVDDGKIIGVGNHKYLIENCKEYKTMVELQRLEGVTKQYA